MKDYIYVSIKTVYGKEAYYPACDLSKGFANLLAQTVLTLGDVTRIKAMGFKVRVVNDQPVEL